MSNAHSQNIRVKWTACREWARVRVGAVLFDLVPFLVRTSWPTRHRRRPPWAWNRNRLDDLTSGPDGEGICCNWEFTRILHVTSVFPKLSRTLVKRMLEDWPIALPHSTMLDYPLDPEVSFIIGHRGCDRIEHLLLTLRSIAGQTLASECIVVEQSFEPEIKHLLPKWVRYHFTKSPSDKYLYNRSWAFNEGTRLARGRIVALHDGDIIVPSEYAAELVRQVSAGFEIVNLKRFIVFLDRSSTQQVFAERTLPQRLYAEQIMENATAGGTVGITKNAYTSIGGMDEAFIGWGGEDTEFWDRCQSLRIADHSYMPFVHLWHTSQPGKAAVDGMGASTFERFIERMKIPTTTRIDELNQKFLSGNMKRTI